MEHGRTRVFRLAAGVVVCVCILATPWWFACLCLTLYALVYRAPIEAVCGGILLDSLYVFTSAGGVGYGYVFVSTFVVLSFVLWWLRARVWS